LSTCPLLRPARELTPFFPARLQILDDHPSPIDNELKGPGRSRGRAKDNFSALSGVKDALMAGTNQHGIGEPFHLHLKRHLGALFVKIDHASFMRANSTDRIEIILERKLPSDHIRELDDITGESARL